MDRRVFCTCHTEHALGQCLCACIVTQNGFGSIWLQTDKASMLDEIIEYVRFLQLQVKVR